MYIVVILPQITPIVCSKVFRITSCFIIFYVALSTIRLKSLKMDQLSQLQSFLRASHFSFVDLLSLAHSDSIPPLPSFSNALSSGHVTHLDSCTTALLQEKVDNTFYYELSDIFVLFTTNFLICSLFFTTNFVKIRSIIHVH